MFPVPHPGDVAGPAPGYTGLGGKPLPNGRAWCALDHRGNQADGRISRRQFWTDWKSRWSSALSDPSRSNAVNTGPAPRGEYYARPGGEISVEGRIAAQLRDQPHQGRA